MRTKKTGRGPGEASRNRYSKRPHFAGKARQSSQCRRSTVSWAFWAFCSCSTAAVSKRDRSTSECTVTAWPIERLYCTRFAASRATLVGITAERVRKYCTVGTTTASIRHDYWRNLHAMLQLQVFALGRERRLASASILDSG